MVSFAQGLRVLAPAVEGRLTTQPQQRAGEAELASLLLAAGGSRSPGPVSIIGMHPNLFQSVMHTGPFHEVSLSTGLTFSCHCGRH